MLSKINNPTIRESNIFLRESNFFSEHFAVDFFTVEDSDGETQPVWFPSNIKNESTSTNK